MVISGSVEERFVNIITAMTGDDEGETESIDCQLFRWVTGLWCSKVVDRGGIASLNQGGIR